MVATRKNRGSLALAGASLFVAAEFSLYSQWSSIVQAMDRARNVIAVLHEAIEVKKEVREATVKVEANRQQAAEILRIVREMQRVISRKTATGCESTKLPF